MADLSTTPNYVASGQIKDIDVTREYGEKGFRKRTFVIVDDTGKYENYYQFEVTKDKCDGLDEFNVGEYVDVWFNIRCNEYKERYYTNLPAWLVKHQEGKQTLPEAAKEAEQAQAEAVDDGDILPF